MHQSIGKKAGILIIVIFMLFALCVPGISYAQDASSKLKDVENKKAEAEESKQEVKDKIHEYQLTLSDLKSQTEKIRGEINTKQAEIDKKNASIEKTQSSIDDRKEGLGERLRAMYKNGSVSYIDIILDSGSFSELMTNLSMIQLIYKSDQKVLTELETAYNKLQSEKEDLEAAQAEMKKSQDALAAKQKEAEETGASLQTELDKVQDEIDAFEAQAQALNAQILAEQQALEEAARQTAQESGGTAEEPSVPSTPAIQGTGVLSWPCSGPITAYFGYYDPFGTGTQKAHGGIDIGVAIGTPICAADSGVVMGSTGYGYNGGYGNLVVIYHGNGLTTMYGHNSSIVVSPGQTVSKGQLIAYSGNTGWSTGPHCHFEVRVNGQRVDPLGYL